MGEVTLKVPAEYVEDFRSAAVSEIVMDAEWLKESAETVERWRLPADHVDSPGDLDDVRGPVRCVGDDLKLAEQVFAADGAVEVRGASDALAHALETLARKVIPPQIGNETNISPFDEETRQRVEHLTQMLGWASGEAARFHALYSAERKADRAGAS